MRQRGCTEPATGRRWRDRDGRADIAVAFPDTDSTWLFPPRAQGEAVRVDPPPRDVRR